jgi:hypothetical protein
MQRPRILPAIRSSVASLSSYEQPQSRTAPQYTPSIPTYLHDILVALSRTHHEHGQPVRWLVLCSGMAPTFVDRDNHRTTHVLSLSLSLSARTMIERKWCGITSNLPLFRRSSSIISRASEWPDPSPDPHMRTCMRACVGGQQSGDTTQPWPRYPSSWRREAPDNRGRMPCTHCLRRSPPSRRPTWGRLPGRFRPQYFLTRAGVT